jgi:transcriptional regulator with XRE-family HTH domain
MQLGKTIVNIRKENNLTQEDFAKRFNVTRQTVSNWENEKSYPDLITLIKISDEFGYSLDSMLKENTDMVEEMNNNLKIGKLIGKMYILYTLLLIVFALCATAVIKFYDALLQVGIDNVWASGFKAGFIAWLVMVIPTIYKDTKKKQTK